MQPTCVLHQGKGSKYDFIKWEGVGASAIVICNHEVLVLVYLRIKNWFSNCSHLKLFVLVLCMCSLMFIVCFAKMIVMRLVLASRKFSQFVSCDDFVCKKKSSIKFYAKGMKQFFSDSNVLHVLSRIEGFEKFTQSFLKWLLQLGTSPNGEQIKRPDAAQIEICEVNQKTMMFMLKIKAFQFSS